MSKLIERPETEILQQIERCKDRVRYLMQKNQNLTVKNEMRSLQTRISELGQEHMAFYGNW